jgi:hypothetical protein
VLLVRVCHVFLLKREGGATLVKSERAHRSQVHTRAQEERKQEKRPPLSLLYSITEGLATFVNVSL